MLKKVTDLTNQGVIKGLNTQPNLFSLDKGQTPNIMNCIVNADGSIERRLGTSTMNGIIICTSAPYGFNVDSASSLTSNLVAFYQMNEISGTRHDSIGGNNLDDNNSVGQSGGIRANAASFVAANSQYLLHTNTSTLTTGDINFSMSAWIYLNSTSTTLERTVISKSDNYGFNLVKLLLHANSGATATTFTDNSYSPKVITASGGAVISTAQQKFGNASVYLATTGDFLNIPASSDFDYGSDDFTIEMFVRWSIDPGAHVIGIWSDQNAADTADSQILSYYSGALTFQFKDTVGALHSLGASHTPVVNQWYHYCITRANNQLKISIDGSYLGTADVTGISFKTPPNPILLGRKFYDINDYYFYGYIDEFRIVKGKSVYPADFTPPLKEYKNHLLSYGEMEYKLYVNTDNIVTFSVSSSGYYGDGVVRATSFGAITTSTWYNIIAFHDTSNMIGVGVNKAINSASYTYGVKPGSAPFVIGAISNGSDSFFDGRIDDLGFWKKLLDSNDITNLYGGGSGNTYQAAFDSSPWASFDFGAGDTRYLTVCAGTGIYASSNLGVTFFSIATDRTANYQYLDRSKNILIATSDSYDKPLYWTGSAGTYAVLLNPSSPLVKYSINYQGFLILCNSNSRKRGFFYEDENSQLTGDWGDSFDIPSSADDEITAVWVLRRNLYVSTRYKIYRVSYVGGNPDWSYTKIKDFGYVPRTAKNIFLKDAGEVTCGLTWDKRIRLFDGSDDKIISDQIKKDNGLCNFSLDKIYTIGTGIIASFAEYDPNSQVYKLGLAIDSSNVTYTLNFDGAQMCFYPFDNTPFNTMCVAESANIQYVMAFSRDGRCHNTNTGNLDSGVRTIDSVYESQILFEKSPSEISKTHLMDLYFSCTSAGNIIFSHRNDFDSSYKEMRIFEMTNDSSKIQHKESIDIGETHNVYQLKIETSANTADSWRLNRIDYFLEGKGIGKN